MDKDILVYSHIPKNAGSSFVEIMRRTNGLKHIDVIQRNRQGIIQYSYKELSKDLRVAPWASSLAGHYIQPWHNYHEYNKRMFWLVILRDPVERFISSYTYQVARYELDENFIQWTKKYGRYNQQVDHLAGEQNLQAAKEIIDSKIDFLGFVDCIDDSFKFLFNWFGIHNEKNMVFPNKNQSPSAIKENANDIRYKYSEIIAEFNELDTLLYEYGKSVYEKKLSDSFNLIPKRNNPIKPSNIKKYANRIQRNLIYKPYARFFN